MERLLSEALSSRNRELEIISMNTNDTSSKIAEEWITGSNDPVTNAVNASISIKRSNDIKRPLEKMNINHSSSSSSSSVSSSSSSLASLHQKKNVSFNENHNEEISISIPYEKETDEQENNNLSFLSKLKVKNETTDSLTHTITLDDYNAESNDDVDDDDANEYHGMHIYTTKKTRGATDAGDYDKFNLKIHKMQNDIDLIKKTQEKILELLQSKMM
jgi:hypothetical protein